MCRQPGYVRDVNPNLARYKEGRVVWESRYAAVFPDGIPCFSGATRKPAATTCR